MTSLADDATAEPSFIDLNDVWQPPPRYDLRYVRERLSALAAEWLPRLFPQARPSPDRKTLRCADLSGRPPRKDGSCIIRLFGPHAGWGYDHATGESAGPIDLIYHVTGLVNSALFEEAARLARVDQPQPPRPVAAPRDHSREIARILDGCRPLAGSVAEAYLQSRGLADPGSPDLPSHDDLADRDTARGWYGMVAVVSDGTGQPTGGIHRTFLLDDGAGKAPPGRKMLGDIAGGHVRLAPLGEDGHLGIAEGIETALAAMAIFSIPTWAGLSTDGIRRFQWPDGTHRVTIFADAGDAGMQAAVALADRLNLAAIENRIVTPRHGDDFNDDLRKGATAKDYDQDAATPSSPPLHTVQEMEAAARALTCPPDSTELARLFGCLAMAQIDRVSTRQLLVTVKATTRIPVSVLEKHLRDLRRQLSGGGTEAAVRPAWASKLRTGEDGSPERNEANVITALTHDEAFAGAFRFNEFRQEVVVTRPMPWDSAPFDNARPWTMTDDVRSAEWLQRREINVTPVVVSRSVAAVANTIRFHPVREYLGQLCWDGTARLDAWLITYLGAADTPLNRAFGARWLISAVARIMRPGAKADHMLILEGPQGTFKSTALKVLAGEDWFTDELAEIGSKDAGLQMLGVWIIEIAEQDAISRAEVSRIKSFLTRTTDRYRPPYERYVISVPRQCVFAGSVNPDTYLRDETGNRRFWPVRVGRVDIDGLRRDRDQLWAEAVVRFREGARWWLDDPDLVAAAKTEQEARYQGDAWDARIDRWLTNERRRVNQGYVGYDDWQEEEVQRPEPICDVSIGEILEQALNIEPGRWTRADQMRVSAYLKARKWERYNARSGNQRAWRYRLPTWLADN